jgi:hypothetical protein
MASIIVTLGLGVPAARSAEAVADRAIAVRAGTLTITVPGTANLGTALRGSSFSAGMGTITVADSRNGSMSWTATVSATNFTTGGGSASETIPKADVAYWSGPAMVAVGGGSRTAGQPTAADRVALTAPVIAFKATKAPLSTTTGWVPTLVITIPGNAVLGTYAGVITHSVA